MSQKRVEYHIKRLQRKLRWVTGIEQLNLQIYEFAKFWRDEFGTTENIPEEVVTILKEKMDEFM